MDINEIKNPYFEAKSETKSSKLNSERSRLSSRSDSKANTKVDSKHESKRGSKHDLKSDIKPNQKTNRKVALPDSNFNIKSDSKVDAQSIHSTIKDANDFYVDESRTFQYDSHYTLHIVGKFPYKSKAFVVFVIFFSLAMAAAIWTVSNYNTKTVQHGDINNKTDHDVAAPDAQHATDVETNIFNRAKKIESTVGGLLIGVFLFVAICAGVLAFEERDDGDQYSEKKMKKWVLKDF